jgi:glycosyltransferase
VSIEHIIIDGGSRDRTIDIVKEAGHVSHVMSEPDDGIYDAMNKGIRIATGDIIGVLNGDDFYAAEHVLARVVGEMRRGSSPSCYGDLHYVDVTDTNRVVRRWRSGIYTSPKQFYWGWMPPHPTFFVVREVYKKYGLFKLELGSAADYEIMLRFLVKHKMKAVYIPEVLVKMRAGGISNASISNRLAAHRMDRKAWRMNGLRPYPWTLWMKPLRKVGQWF